MHKDLIHVAEKMRSGEYPQTNGLPQGSICFGHLKMCKTASFLRFEAICAILV